MIKIFKTLGLQGPVLLHGPDGTISVMAAPFKVVVPPSPPLPNVSTCPFHSFARPAWPYSSLWLPTHQGFEESNLSYLFLFLSHFLRLHISTYDYSNLSDAQESNDTEVGWGWGSVEGGDQHGGSRCEPWNQVIWVQILTPLMSQFSHL